MYNVIISEVTQQKVEAYLQELKSNPENIGQHLKETLNNNNIKIADLTKETLLDYLIQSKKPKIFAESPQLVTGDNRSWNQNELSILGDINVTMNVQVYDNGNWFSPTAHSKPFNAGILYTPGALLKNKNCPDYKEVVKDGKVDKQALKALYERRLLPMLLNANKECGDNNEKGFFAIPGLGCGEFAGDYKAQVVKLFPEILQEIINENKDKLQNIQGYYCTPGPGQAKSKVDGPPAFILDDPMRAPPLLSHPSVHGEQFKDCKLFKVVAWDHASWPGNDFYALNDRNTDDGVSAAATNTIEKLTGIKGNYVKGKYLPPQGYRDWQEVIEKNGLKLTSSGRVKVINHKAQKAEVDSPVIKAQTTKPVTQAMGEMGKMLAQSADPNSFYNQWIKNSPHEQKVAEFSQQLSKLLQGRPGGQGAYKIPLALEFMDAIRNLGSGTAHLETILEDKGNADIKAFFEKNMSFLKSLNQSFMEAYAKQNPPTPKFVELNTSVKPKAGTLINDEQSLQKFIDEVKQGQNAKHDVIYVVPKMKEALSEAAKNLPAAYKEGFENIQPSGAVGFTMSMGQRLQRLKEGREVVQDLREGRVGLEEQQQEQRQPREEGQRLSSETNINDLLDDLEGLGSLAELQTPPPHQEETLFVASQPQRSVLYNQQRQSDTATNTAENVVEPARKFSYPPHEIDMDIYDKLFSGMPYNNLASFISALNHQVEDQPNRGRTYNFKNHLDNVLPLMTFAIEGTKKAWADAENPEDKAEILAKLETFEAIEGMLKSLRALANNKSRYTEKNYEARLEKIIELLDKQEIPQEVKDELMDSLNETIIPHLSADKPNMFHQHKKGSTAFDATGDSLEIKGHQKRLKIEHSTSSDDPPKLTVTGKFNYSRKAVIGVQTGKFQGIKKHFAGRENQLSEMNAQVSDFVTVALNEYQKGTRENPIFLQPSQGNQAELSLAILMEFKKRAILEGRELIASDDTGKRIKITPDTKFSEAEKAYFEHFAMQVPKLDVGKWRNPISAENSAAFQLFKDVKMEDGRTLKDYAYKDRTIDNISEVMSQHLKTSIAAEQKQQAKSMGVMLETVSAAMEATVKEERSSSARM
ncbi:hypothetical protein [Candidatus Berkiella aquae]|uniref:Macrodomain effector MavL domain-containing protein n=1 Tax=Candidatus Berkiella aquae TaxID=295108 RepID=A0A0Q9YYD8_9GAMM|nr:hypothetical protein [Candidatus Berkiella aquae]MCS5711146.1 hypothetical protein [Candidatus Berkiella aquae]